MCVCTCAPESGEKKRKESERTRRKREGERADIRECSERRIYGLYTAWRSVYVVRTTAGVRDTSVYVHRAAVHIRNVPQK